MKNLICIHGNSLKSDIFKPLSGTEMNKDYKFWLIDLPGKALNENIEQITIHSLLDYITETINEIHGPKYIVAHSLSGHLILQCLKNLHGIGHLFLVGTPPLGSLTDYPKAITTIPGQLLAKAELSNMEIDIIAKATCPVNSVLVKKMVGQTSPEFRKRLFESLSSYDYQNEVQAIKNTRIPVSLLFSKNDGFVDIEYLRKLKVEFRVHTNITFIEGTYIGHVPFLSEPEWFSKMLKTSFVD